MFTAKVKNKIKQAPPAQEHISMLVVIISNVEYLSAKRDTNKRNVDIDYEDTEEWRRIRTST